MEQQLSHLIGIAEFFCKGLHFLAEDLNYVGSS